MLTPIVSALIILIVLAAVILTIMAACQPNSAEDDSQVIKYTANGKVSNGELWKR